MLILGLNGSIYPEYRTSASTGKLFNINTPEHMTIYTDTLG